MNASTSKAIGGINRKFQSMIRQLPANTLGVLAVVVLSGAIGSYLLTGSHAATPTSSTEAENGTVSSSASSITDSTASSGAAVKFGAGAVSSPPPTGFPDATNTGYKHAPGYTGSLTTFSGAVQSNTTYSFKYFPSGVTLGTASSPLTNVTFIGCRFASNAVDDADVRVYGDNISFDYDSFEPSAVSSPPVAFGKGYQYPIDVDYAGAVTINHADMWGYGNGVQVYYSTQAKPFIMKNSWMHDTSATINDPDGRPHYHIDGILFNDGGPSYMVIDHNTIVAQGNTNGIALQYNGTGYDHVTITNNYLSGFGYTVNLGGNGFIKNLTFTGNTWGTDIQQYFYYIYDWVPNAASNNLWRNNKVHYVNTVKYQGDGSSAASNLVTAADDGKYWTPNGISTTDYSGN